MMEMIHRLRIENSKSIKELDLELNRINILIGEPDTGKSNILEAISILTRARQLVIERIKTPIDNYVHMKNMRDLFYN